MVDNAGDLVGIVEARDLLRIDSSSRAVTLRELARPDYVLAHPGDSVDRVHREMLHRNVENVVIVESSRSRRPLGIARAGDILALRRWVVEEEHGELRRDLLEEPADSPGIKLA